MVKKIQQVRNDHRHQVFEFSLLCCIITYKVGDITYKVGDKMLEPLLGSEALEKVLIFLLSRQKGYASELASFYDTDLNQIQKQLKKLEDGGILVSFSEGRTRLFEFNPSYAFLPELKTLLEKALQFYPSDEIERLKMNRRRPRRTGKPL
jgi:hypothetical protein